jgi:hypothetical protein
VATFGSAILVPFGFVISAATSPTAIIIAQWLAANTPIVPMIFAKVVQMMPGSAEVKAANAEIERQSRKPGLVGGGKTSTKKEAAASSKKSTHPMVLRSRQKGSGGFKQEVNASNGSSLKTKQFLVRKCIRN